MARPPEHEPFAPLSLSARVTVNLIPRAKEALDKTTQTTGLNQTDVINRALQVYAYLEEQMGEGKELWIEEPDTGDRHLLRFL